MKIASVEDLCPLFFFFFVCSFFRFSCSFLVLFFLFFSFESWVAPAHAPAHATDQKQGGGNRKPGKQLILWSSKREKGKVKVHGLPHKFKM